VMTHPGNCTDQPAKGDRRRQGREPALTLRTARRARATIIPRQVAFPPGLYSNQHPCRQKLSRAARYDPRPPVIRKPGRDGTGTTPAVRIIVLNATSAARRQPVHLRRSFFFETIPQIELAQCQHGQTARAARHLVQQPAALRASRAVLISASSVCRNAVLEGVLKSSSIPSLKRRGLLGVRRLTSSADRVQRRVRWVSCMSACSELVVE